MLCMLWINTSTLKLNASRGISRISEQGLEPLRRLSKACLPPRYSKPSGASVTHRWAAVFFQDPTLGWASCFSLFMHLSESISREKVNQVFTPLKMQVGVGVGSTSGILGAFKERWIKYEGEIKVHSGQLRTRSRFLSLLLRKRHFGNIHIQQ